MKSAMITATPLLLQPHSVNLRSHHGCSMSYNF